MQLRPSRGGVTRILGRGLTVAIAAAVVGVLVAACGGSPSASVANLGTSSTTTTTTASSNDGGSGNPSSNSGSGGSVGGHATIGLGGVTVRFTQCMRSHGVAMPDPNGQGQVTMNGVNPQSSSFQAAQRACAKYAPNGGRPPSAAQIQQMESNALKFSMCMRSHGISDFPDPQISTSGGGLTIGIRIHGGPGSDVNPRNPKFQTAQAACQSLVPFGKGPTSEATKSR